jgi:hypothetical protein
VCAVSLCALMLVLLPPVWRGITSPWSEWLDFGDGWACLQHGVTFEHRQVKGEGMSVNEAVYTGTVVRTGGDDGVKWIWLQWGGLALPQKEVR